VNRMRMTARAATKEFGLEGLRQIGESLIVRLDCGLCARVRQGCGVRPRTPTHHGACDPVASVGPR
jgi:hypothetical protein